MESILSYLSMAFLPFFSLLIIFFGIYKRAPIYDYFIQGTKEGIKTAFEILPFLIGIYIAINSLTTSGLLDFLFLIFKPLFLTLNIPIELLPLILLRPISGSGSFVVLQEILEKVGVDTYTGLVACSMCGGCETVIYALSLYFGVTHVKKTRHALLGGLLAYFSGIIVSLLICSIV